ncbi:hypothetical protein WISP_36869 [Willisornis vidua]|uniref:Uncharacterized protein n=1 Tax=Willisornis vidua TaxID=1566151 RepID=A0ABQ9DI66_9PASS|nr:hypothetical protein WISP_36869 [Willisornis vidua]
MRRFIYCKVVLATSLLWVLVDVFLLLYFSECNKCEDKKDRSLLPALRDVEVLDTCQTPIPARAVESWNPRLVWVGRDPSSATPAMGRDSSHQPRWLQALSSLALDTPRDEEFRTNLGWTFV